VNAEVHSQQWAMADRIEFEAIKRALPMTTVLQHYRIGEMREHRGEILAVFSTAQCRRIAGRELAAFDTRVV